jgi:predicted methyltransferase
MTCTRVSLFAVALVALAGCAGTPSSTPAPAASSRHHSSEAATAAALDQVLAGPQRTSANRARDPYRHPKETLLFFGLRDDMTVLEVWPGAGGWWTEILAPLLAPHGRYIAAGFDPKSDNKYIQDGLKAFQAKLDGDPAGYGKVVVTSLQAPNALSPVPPESVDLVLTFRNFHNWLGSGNAEAMLKAMYDALKPGGILGVEDHRAAPGAPIDPQVQSGYVNEQLTIDLIRKAGFEYLGSSEINANPKDTKDYEMGVWTLPPTYRLGDKDRARYAEIGESDRFTLKFRKPLHAKHH